MTSQQGWELFSALAILFSFVLGFALGVWAERH